jgi:hypothetical protein
MIIKFKKSDFYLNEAKWNRYRYLSVWHNFFAILPIRISSDEVAMFQWVKRRYYYPTRQWEYKLNEKC